MKLATTALERVAIVLASLLLSIGLIALLSGFFQSHDPAGISGTSSAIGQQFRDLGDTHLQVGEFRPPYDSDPPTSGPHVSAPVTRDNAQLTDDQLLTALEAGNVVIAYGTAQPPPELPKLERAVAGPFTQALAATGQAVILWRRPGTGGVIALAWTRMLHLRSATGPLLQEFAAHWLGRGADGR